jgi:hypothetical protein
MFVEKIAQFDQSFLDIEELSIINNQSIIELTDLEDKGKKSKTIANHLGTYEYIVFCNN